MYVATFYSYKGGVGRTMALINIALLLSQMDKRVLIVDFDLEAPGLPSFDMFRAAGNQPGLVDYVCAFRDSGKAPDVRDFIVKCVHDDGYPVWLMPAGRHSLPGYADKLYSIDWKDLYENHSGYLMFEDMRYQWRQHPAKFDYVLIDSRTGHTDVGGICTRQLPDAVAVMFLPNEQNIEGLRPIVEAIGDERDGKSKPKIALHFCPSNVPDLDDENDILKNMLDVARVTLGYAKPAAILHHYNSMDLLTQPAFAVERPNSKLSAQYRLLVDDLLRSNYSDPAGAELALEDMPRRYETARRDGDQAELRAIEAAATRIAALHPENGAIAWLLSILYARMGALEEELESLTLAIDHGRERNRAIIRRARVLSALNQKVAAVDDLKMLLSSGTATTFDILSSIDLLRAVEPHEWVKPIQSAIEQLQASADTYLALLPSLMSDRERLPIAVGLAERVLNDRASDPVEKNSARTWLVLGLIGLGSFERALAILGETVPDPLQARRTSDIFNHAIAHWGATRAPHIPHFERALAMMHENRVQEDANWFQCQALARMLVGQFEQALESIEAARARARTGVLIFSCWRYLEVSGTDMLKDLDAMAQAIVEGSSFEPAFFNEVRRLVPDP